MELTTLNPIHSADHAESVGSSKQTYLPTTRSPGGRGGLGTDATTAALRAAGEPRPKGPSGLAGAAFNFVNSVVGAGIIGIPFALRRAGFWTGLLLLAGVATVTAASIRMLVDCALKVPPHFPAFVTHS